MVRLLVSELHTAPPILVRNASRNAKFGLYKAADKYKVYDVVAARYLTDSEILQVQRQGREGMSFENLVRDGKIALEHNNYRFPPFNGSLYKDVNDWIRNAAKEAIIANQNRNKTFFSTGLTITERNEIALLEDLGFPLENYGRVIPTKLKIPNARMKFAEQYGLQRDLYAKLSLAEYEQLVTQRMQEAVVLKKQLDDVLTSYGFGIESGEKNVQRYFNYHGHEKVRFDQQFFDMVVRKDQLIYKDITEGAAEGARYQHKLNNRQLFTYEQNGRLDTWVVEEGQVVTRLSDEEGIQLIYEAIGRDYRAGNLNENLVARYKSEDADYLVLRTQLGDHTWKIGTDGERPVSRLSDDVSQMESVLNQAIIRHSDNETVFVRVESYSPTDDVVMLQFGEQRIEVAVNELERMLAGESQSVPAALEQALQAHKGKKIVVWRDGFFQGLEHVEGVNDVIHSVIKLPMKNERNVVNSHRLASRMNELTDVPVFYSESFERARAVDRSVVISGPEDIAVIDAASLGLNDFGFSRNQKKMLERKGFKTGCTNDPTCFSDQKVVLIFAHKEEEFRQAIKQLAENDGLKGKYLLSFSCFADNEAVFTQRFIQESGVNGIFLFDELINGNSTRETLYWFTKKYATDGGDLRDLMRESIKKANSKVRETELKKGVNKLKAGTWYVDVPALFHDHQNSF